MCVVCICFDAGFYPASRFAQEENRPLAMTGCEVQAPRRVDLSVGLISGASSGEEYLLHVYNMFIYLHVEYSYSHKDQNR